MLIYTTGDLFQSPAEALVNTVNCEGFMGKGIAYQFKRRFPETNIDYVKVCKKALLHPGKMHVFKENNKVIINFPTKDKWREKSKIEYIYNGLDALIQTINKLKIKSIAIPPLGCGNGGLIWSDVRQIITDKLENIAENIDIYIYEPSKNLNKITEEPKLNASALVLMKLKENLTRFNSVRLQKAAYFMNLTAKKKIFNFVSRKYGPYDSSIDFESKKIREFQKYHGTKSTRDAEMILYNKIVSNSVNNMIIELLPNIVQSCTLVNNIESDGELEALAKICFLLETSGVLSKEEIFDKFAPCSNGKYGKISVQNIDVYIEKLYDFKILEKNLVGYNLAKAS